MGRVLLGVVLLLAGIVVAVGVLAANEWDWPLSILVPFALALPGMALIEPPLERRVSRWLGRTQ